MKLRHTVEIGVAYGSPGGQWGTIYVYPELPEEADEDEIEAKALDLARKELADEHVGHLWAHYFDPEAEEIDE